MLLRFGCIETEEKTGEGQNKNLRNRFQKCKALLGTTSLSAVGRTTHVFVGVEITARPKAGNQIGFANVGTFHQHVQRTFQVCRFTVGLVVNDGVSMVVVAHGIVVMAAKLI